MTSPEAAGAAQAESGPGDDPEAYVAEDRRWAVHDGRDVDGRRTGSVLFADVSGFTALTETLTEELGAQRGAETLTAVLETVFHELIGCLHEVGGSVVYFSGDAVTCWVDGDDGRLATSCAFAMQEVMARVGLVRSPGGSTVTLSVKVAVAAGTAQRFVVGDPAVQLIDVLAGALMDEVAAAEHEARPGEVVVTAAVLEALGDTVTRVQPRQGESGPVAAVGGLTHRAPPITGWADSPALPPETARHWLLPAIYTRMQAGRGEFLAELRPAVPVFVQFEGIDFDGDPDAPDLLDAFVVSAQRIIDGHGGSLLQLTVGDKGAYLYAVFGSPQAHEDDAGRACAAALELLELRDQTITDLRVGVAAGRLRSGTYGHRRRRTFCCLGSPVNLSARLMGRAPAGGVMVSDEVRRAAGPDFEFGDVELLDLKGRARPTPAARLLGRAAGAVRGLTPLVGRHEELGRLQEALRSTAAGAGRVVGISGEPGVGKSRLLVELLALAEAAGVATACGSGGAHGIVSAYSAWWGLWRELLAVPGGVDQAGLADHLERVLPGELRPRAPLVGALVGIPLPDNELTGGFDAKLRKTSLESLASRLLELRATSPLVLLLDDAHLLEPLGRDLVVTLARAVAHLPVLLLLSYRGDTGPLLGLDLDGVVTHEELRLSALGEDPARLLAAEELAGLYGGADLVPAGLVDLVVQRADGNPLWVRELCRYLHERAESGSTDADSLDLPDTLHGLVLSRIDGLPETPRRTAKVASVVGQAFSAGLARQAYPDLGAAGEVRRALQALDRRQVARPEDLGEDLWAFTHALLHDVAYETLPFAMRSILHHRVAEAIVAGALGDPGRHLDALAHHYWHSDDDDAKRRWLRRAGEAAQTAYANDAALEHYRRLLTLLTEPEQVEPLIRVGKILELQADWAAAEESFTRALALATAAEDRAGCAWAQTWLAEVARKQGHFPQAETGLAEAAGIFTALRDDAGLAQVQHLSGTLAAQQGKLDDARRHYERSLAVRQGLGDRSGMAALYSNLAIVAEYEGDLALAEELAGRGLALRRELGDRWGIGISQNNLGMLATLRGDPLEARTRFRESMALHTEVGDTWMVALGHNNLGNAARDLGEHDEARAAYATALEAYRRYGDQWVLAILLEDVALLCAALGRPEDAWRLVGASDALHEQVGSPRTPDVSARLGEALAPYDDTMAGAAPDLRAEAAAWPPERVDELVRAR